MGHQVSKTETKDNLYISTDVKEHLITDNSDSQISINIHDKELKQYATIYNDKKYKKRVYLQVYVIVYRIRRMNLE